MPAVRVVARSAKDLVRAASMAVPKKDCKLNCFST